MMLMDSDIRKKGHQTSELKGNKNLQGLFWREKAEDQERLHVNNKGKVQISELETV